MMWPKGIGPVAVGVLLCILQVNCGNTPALSAPSPKSKPAFLNSYLPAAMQVLAHLTNQLKYERETTTTSKPATATNKPATTTNKPTTATNKPATETNKPATSTTQTTTTTTTAKPTTTASTTTTTEKLSTSSTPKPDSTTASHRPGNFAPLKPGIQRIVPEFGVLSDPDSDTPVPPIISGEIYSSELLLPKIQSSEEGIPVLSASQPDVSEYVKEPDDYSMFLQPSRYYFEESKSPPLFLPGNYAPYSQDSQSYPNWFEKARTSEETIYDSSSGSYPDLGSVPIETEENFKNNPLELEPDELSEENLQYLAPSVREILDGFHGERNAQDKNNPTSSYQSIEELYDSVEDKKDVGDWLRSRKAAVTQTYIQLLLLYDLLSRDAKTQKLNNYHGYTPDLVKDLMEISQGTAAEQLKTVLDRMVARGDCKYDFANNRAKDIVKELNKPESKTSMEVRYLEPLRYSP